MFRTNFLRFIVIFCKGHINEINERDNATATTAQHKGQQFWPSLNASRRPAQKYIKKKTEFHSANTFNNGTTPTSNSAALALHRVQGQNSGITEQITLRTLPYRIPPSVNEIYPTLGFLKCFCTLQCDLIDSRCLRESVLFTAPQIDSPAETFSSGSGCIHRNHGLRKALFSRRRVYR